MEKIAYGLWLNVFHVPRASDHRPVEKGGLPGPAGVRELQAAAAGATGRRAGAPAGPLPHATLRGHGARRLAGPLPALQGQPVADAQQPVRLGPGEETRPDATHTEQQIHEQAHV